MKLRNSFSEEDRQLFFDIYKCWICGRNTNDAGHHIVGRGHIGSTVESSILNFAPVCNFSCHLNIHGKLMTKEYQKKLLKKTRKYLETIHYQFTSKDKDFIIKYKDLYE